MNTEIDIPNKTAPVISLAAPAAVFFFFRASFFSPSPPEHLPSSSSPPPPPSPLLPPLTFVAPPLNRFVCLFDAPAIFSVILLPGKQSPTHDDPRLAYTPAVHPACSSLVGLRFVASLACLPPRSLNQASPVLSRRECMFARSSHPRSPLLADSRSRPATALHHVISQLGLPRPYPRALPPR